MLILRGVTRTLSRATAAALAGRSAAAAVTVPRAARAFATSFNLRATASSDGEKAKPKPRKAAAAKKPAVKKKAAAKKKPVVKKKKKVVKKKAAPKKPKKKAVVKPKKPKTSSSLKPPKAPSTPWILYLKDRTAEEKASLAAGAKLPTATSLATKFASSFRALSSSERASLESRAAEERDAYPAKLAEWTKTLTPEMIKEENLIRARRRKLGLGHKRRLRIAGEPSRPRSAYILFSTDVRAGKAHAGKLDDVTSITEQSKVIAAIWRELDADEKEPYLARAAEDVERYTREKTAFEESRAQ